MNINSISSNQTSYSNKNQLSFGTKPNIQKNLLESLPETTQKDVKKWFAKLVKDNDPDRKLDISGCITGKAKKIKVGVLHRDAHAISQTKNIDDFLRQPMKTLKELFKLADTKAKEKDGKVKGLMLSRGDTTFFEQHNKDITLFLRNKKPV